MVDMNCGYRTLVVLFLELGIFQAIWQANRFSGVNRIEFPPSLICLAICKADASSASLLVTKRVLITLYYELKQFTDILIHIFT